MTTDLFRTEVLDARRTSQMGTVVLARPFSMSLLTLVAVLFTVSVVAFLVAGTYTRHSTVYGHLVPVGGIVKVYAPQSGIVLEKRIHDGGMVREGDVLYVLSTDRQNSAAESVQATISRESASRLSSLLRERDETVLLQRAEIDTLQAKISGYEAERARLTSQINSARQRVKLAREVSNRYQTLSRQDYVTREQYQQKIEDLLERQNQLLALQREHTVAERNLELARRDLISTPLQHEAQLSKIDRDISVAKQSITESEGKRSLLVTAPLPGTVTSTVAERGQMVEPSLPLVSIVPNDVKLQAYLYAPSRSVGFVKDGDSVVLRYQAYPYQKFGQYGGTVTSVARTALPATELVGLGAGVLQESASASSEPVYRITVALERQDVIAYQRSQPLQAGMLLEADVLRDTRRLYEWVFEPLYSMKRTTTLPDHP